MDKDELKILLDRHTKGLCTEEELEKFKQWQQNLENAPGPQLPEDFFGDYDDFAEQQYEAFLKHYAGKKKSTKQRMVGNWWKIAALIVFVIGLGTILDYLISYKTSHVQQLPAVVFNGKNTGQVSAQSRYIKLPDGSIVILHSGSTFEIDSSRFNIRSRELTLNGEAYFDVQHDPSKPFIIHTGTVTTTVLGTAFNIRQSGDSVTVIVTRGKVEVKDKQKLLAVLLPDQQIVYDSHMKEAVQQQVAAQHAITWLKNGLNFKDETLEDVSKRLQARYHVSISFTNPRIRNCRITVTEAFEGTESLDTLLSIICPIINATYQTTPQGIVIDGPGCPAN